MKRGFEARQPGCGVTVSQDRVITWTGTAAKGRTGKSCQSNELSLCAYVEDEDTL